MKILNGPAALRTIRESLQADGGARLAVAYWGTGAVERLGLRNLRDKNLTLVCDARSGGCDPKELRKLSRLLGSNLLTLDRLHAKAWIFETSAVIGSSNASTNGFGPEGSEAESLIEINLLTSDRSLVSDLTEWFDSSVLAQARVVDAEIIAQARRARVQRAPAPRYRASLLDEARARSAVTDEPIYVWVYPYGDQDLADEVAEIGRLRGIKNLDYWQDVGVQELAQPPGSYVIDFDASNSGKPKFGGVYRTLREGHVATFRRGKTNALLCVRTRKRVFDQPLGDVGAWRDAAQKARQAEAGREVWPLSEFVNYL